MCKIQVYLYYIHILLRTLGGASESNKILRKSYASVNGGQLNISMLFLHNNIKKRILHYSLKFMIRLLLRIYFVIYTCI